MLSEAAAQNPRSAPLAPDIGPLAWVGDELRKSLESANKAVRRFVRDADAARGTDLASVDDGQLRLARQQLHQAVGAMEMEGQSQLAQMLRGMELAVQRFLLHPDQCNEAAASTLERASFALIEYTQAVLAGRAVSPVTLYPQYREVQQLAGAERIHPADLWPTPWRWVEIGGPAASPVAYDATTRARLDQDILRVMKAGSRRAAGDLSALSLGLGHGESARQPALFWKLSAGFFEGLAQDLIRIDVYSKRAASKVLLQYTSLARGDKTISERLTHDLLFFCAAASPSEPAAAAALAAVRKAYRLDATTGIDYEQRRFGLFDPAALVQARKRIEALKESWSSIAGGELARVKAAADQFGLVAESQTRLHPASSRLAAG